jgi:hypothetical protein
MSVPFGFLYAAFTPQPVILGAPIPLSRFSSLRILEEYSSTPLYYHSLSLHKRFSSGSHYHYVSKASSVVAMKSQSIRNIAITLLFQSYGAAHPHSAPEFENPKVLFSRKFEKRDIYQG